MQLPSRDVKRKQAIKQNKDTMSNLLQVLPHRTLDFSTKHPRAVKWIENRTFVIVAMCAYACVLLYMTSPHFFLRPPSHAFRAATGAYLRVKPKTNCFQKFTTIRKTAFFDVRFCNPAHPPKLFKYHNDITHSNASFVAPHVAAAVISVVSLFPSSSVSV